MIVEKPMGRLRGASHAGAAVAWSAVGRIAVALFLGALLAIARGPAWADEADPPQAREASFKVFPNQVFTTDKPGQLGLYIEGEDWHLLLDMPGFQGYAGALGRAEFFMPGRFFFLRNPASGTTASMFAERVPGADREKSCREWYASPPEKARDATARLVGERGTVGKVVEVERHGKRLQVFESEDRKFGPSKAIFWRPWYRGYCFDLHFNVTSPAAEEEVLRIFDSLTYVAGKPTGVDIGRVFGFAGRTLMRLSVPIDWRYQYRPGPPGPFGGAELLPSLEAIPSFLVFPLGTRKPGDQQSLSDIVDEYRRSSEARMRLVSPVREVCSTGTCVYFFDLQYGRSDARDSRAYEYQRRGWAEFGGMVMGLSLLYREDSKSVAERITDAFSRAQVVDVVASNRALAGIVGAPDSPAGGPNRVFATGKAGQLGLRIEGENWHLLLDLPGFDNEARPPDGGGALLKVSNRSTGATVTVAGRRIEGVDTAESCRRYGMDMIDRTRQAVAREQGQQDGAMAVSAFEANGKELYLVELSSKKPGSDYPVKLMHWFPYHRGFCFSFLFTSPSPEAEKEVLRVLDSATFVDQEPQR
ncbi:hypothetical protein [Accumulibacter sp.]|uniref:hypothetical protein n=1 Tax=Accumulibacter sp. TaxID=2053492 RepID=UPI0025FE976D|nr:hypothetical protein [Accumulibacter sp.]MCM8596443.1 hypothetical protein [Accumulibacter sp.]MCM8627081.1 hypothetical protein [Accumulibacter sp.]MDS4050592.1 hypothetical protein [Accumulibacter sp.]